MSNKTAIILINYKTYAEKYLGDFLDSFAKQDHQGEMKLFIVDNETSDKSYNAIKTMVETQNFASLQYDIIRNQNNDGFAKGNNDAMRKAMEQDYENIILFNMDTVLAPDCISKMVEAGEISNDKFPISNQDQNSTRLPGGQESKKENLSIGCVQARLMLWPDMEKINSLGNTTHFLGFGYCENYGENYNDYLKKESIIDRHATPANAGSARDDRNVCYPSGAAVLFKREVLEKIGLFNEEYWMYNEDQEIGWRLWLAGYKCVLAPDAVAYHKYEFSRSITKYYWMDRNRIISMLLCYHWLTLVLISPAFIIWEFGLLFFAFKGGWFKDKIKVYKYFLSLKNWKFLSETRKKNQHLRQVKDRDIIKMFSGHISYQEIESPVLKIANFFMNIYWQMVKVIIFW